MKLELTALDYQNIDDMVDAINSGNINRYEWLKEVESYIDRVKMLRLHFSDCPDKIARLEKEMWIDQLIRVRTKPIGSYDCA